MPSSHLILCCPLLLPQSVFCQHQGLFQWVSSLHQVAKILELQVQHRSFQWIFSTDFLYDGLVWYPCSPRDSQESFPTPLKAISSSALSLLYSPTLTSIQDSWGKNIDLIRWTYVGKVMSQLSNILSSSKEKVPFSFTAQWNYEPCRVGPPKMDGQVLVESSDKMQSTGEGNS